MIRYTHTVVKNKDTSSLKPLKTSITNYLLSPRLTHVCIKLTYSSINRQQGHSTYTVHMYWRESAEVEIGLQALRK